MPVSITHRIGASRHWSSFQTPLAQRQSAGLIILRSGGSKPPGGIYHTSHRCIKALEQHTYNRHGAEVARVAHNHEDTGSKPVAGIYHTSHRCTKALEQLRIPLSSDGKSARLITWRSCDRNIQGAFNRHGAGVARVAHNHEDTGSKPVAGIHLFQFCRNWCGVDITQRTRGGANLFQGREFESHYQCPRLRYS